MPMITLRDYDIYLENASMIAQITTVGSEVILGSGSLVIDGNSAGLFANVSRQVSPRQFTSGVGYCITKQVSTGVGPHWGYGFNWSQEDLTGGSGSAYGLMLRKSTGDTVSFRLIKFTAGLAATPPSPLQVGSAGTLAIGETASIVVRWITHNDFGPGVWIRGYIQYNGTATPTLPDYSDSATPDIDYIDASSPLLTSSGEGEMASFNNNTNKVVFDRVGRLPRIAGVFT